MAGKTETVTVNVKSNIGETTKDASELAGEFKILGVSLNGVKAGFKAVGASAKASFATIKAGMTSTGIGALVIAIASLLTYFTSTKRGADKLSQGMAGLSAGFDVLIDRVSMFGEGLSMMFNPMTMKKGAKMMADAFKNIGTEIAADVKAMTALEKRTQSLRDADNEFMVQKAATRKEIEKARLIAEDETKSAEERLDNIKKALELEAQTTERELELARERMQIQLEEMAVSENSAADEERLAQLKTEIIEKETASIKMRRRVVTEVNALENEIRAAEKARAKEKEDEAKEEAERLAKIAEEEKLAKEEREEQLAGEAEKLKELREENFLAEIDDIQRRAEERLRLEYEAQLKEIADYENFLDIKKELDEKYDRDRRALSKREDSWSEMSSKQRLKTASSTAGNLATIFGEESKAGKAFAITQATIDTFASANSAYKSMAGIPVVGPALGGIAAAAAVAAGLKNVQAIKSGGKGGGGGGGPRGSASQMPAPQMMSGEFNLAGGDDPDPVKAFVVTDEMSNSQNQLANIRRRATI